MPSGPTTTYAVKFDHSYPTKDVSISCSDLPAGTGVAACADLCAPTPSCRYFWYVDASHRCCLKEGYDAGSPMRSAAGGFFELLTRGPPPPPLDRPRA